LQAASVIGRRFDSELLAVAAEETDIDNRLASIQALDLVHTDGGSTDYVFKHALVRDALYESLLTERRQGLHARIAEEIEYRSGNRLTEVAEILAYHYSHTRRDGKAFAYLYLAGTKSISIYSIDEAATHLTAALALLDKNPDCASDAQVTDFLLSYLSLLDMTAQIKREIDVLPRYLARIDRLGDDPRVVIFRVLYVGALVASARYREAAAMQRETSRMADRLGDAGLKAWALLNEVRVSNYIEPKPLHEFEILKTEAIKAASDEAEAYVQKSARELYGLLHLAWASRVFRQYTWLAIGLEEAARGRMNDARDAARELAQLGRRLNDPRSTGFGLWLLSIVALMSQSYAEALEYSEQSLAVSVTPMDQSVCTFLKLSALVALRRAEEGAMPLEEFRRRCVADGLIMLVNGTDVFFAACKILQGNIRDGFHLIEEAILKREKEGDRSSADSTRLFLAEIYLQMITGEKPPPLPILLRNLPTILRVMMTAHSRIPDLVKRVMASTGFDPAGHHIGHAQMILGLFYKVKKKRVLALQHLTEARRILSQFGETPILARVETALAELGQ
jgi:hypothetical protein